MPSLPTAQRIRSFTFVVVLAIAAIAADVYHAQVTTVQRGKFVAVSVFENNPTSHVDGLTTATPARVAIARSDDPALPEPVTLHTTLTYAQVEAMTRRAVELAGGFEDLIQPGDQVLIKPCIVSPSVSRNTDVRVVKAVARLVHEAAGGDVEVVIGEGSAFPTPSEMEFAPREKSPSWERLWDAGGYDQLLTDPDLEGINLRLSNLNGPWEDLVYVDVPEGGFADLHGGKVWVHRDVLEADVHITVPALKPHSFVRITVGLKNNIGLYAATKYGFPREVGVPQLDYSLRLHVPDRPRYWVDEEIVDMAMVAGIDFTVVDAIRSNYHKNRHNAIVAGRDVVAVDHVSARLMGVNPDDVGHLTLASLAGLGTNDPEHIEVVGSTIDANVIRFAKNNYFNSDFGQSNRVWLLRGPFPAEGIEDPMEHAFIPDEANTVPRPGVAGWSEAIYFFDDRIDLKTFYSVERGTRTLAYAFTYFDAPRDQEAQLWLGSDEAIAIYLNGSRVYLYDGRRTFGDDQLVKEKATVQIRAGENTLLVKCYQDLSNFDFSLNICEPESDRSLDGDRVLGLEFRTGSDELTAVTEPSDAVVPQGFELGPNYPNPFNTSTVIPYRVPAADGQPLPTRLEILNLQGQRVLTLVARLTQPGRYLSVWDGHDEHGRTLASGVYLCRLTAGTQVAMRKLLLVR
jgi:uncharacterized protein (DUF362 family)